jgi:hypothetical protein
MSIKSKAYPRKALCFKSCDSCTVDCEPVKQWVPLEEAQKLEDENQLYQTMKIILQDNLTQTNKLYAKCREQINEANKILDLAELEDLTGAHKIHWSNWVSLREVLK